MSRPTPEFGAIERAFAAVLEAPADRRERAIHRVCGGDAALEAEVRRLIGTHAGAGRFLEHPPPTPAGVGAAAAGNDPEPLGRRFGAYRSVGLIGAGGMGAVYLCRRVDEQFEKDVAVKIIHRWIDTDEVLDRFEQERRLLAQLQHPNIAMLLDAGLTDDGAPFIVMEHVDGRPLDAHCRERELSIEDRLGLFLSVCEAVQAAHAALVVHLDIKPSNILVTGSGLVKLVDFGVSQLLERRAGGDDGARALSPAFTPAYAAPEQIEAGPVSTATDVYALGAVLYHLLTNARPFSSAEETGAPIERTILTRPPTPPSRASGPAGKTPLAPADRRRLAGELDAIVLRAMAKRPEDRYATASALADDIRRHLERRPVSAMPDTFAYRASRFVRRNRVVVSAAAVLALAVAGGTSGVAWQASRAAYQRDRAEQRFDDLRRLSNVLITEVDKKLADLPGSIDARRVIITESRTYLDSLASELRDDPDLMLEVAGSYVQLALIQRNLRSADLGDTDAALANQLRAEELRERVLAMRPGDPEALGGLAESGVFIGDMRRAQGDLDAAVASYRQSQQRYDELLAVRSDLATAVLHNRAVLLAKLGIVEATRGNLEPATEAYAAALALNEEILAEDPASTLNLHNKAVSLERLGEVLELRGDASGAHERLTSAHAIYARLAEAEPDNTQRLFTLAVSHSKVGEVLGHPSYSNLGDLDGAIREFRAGERIVRGLVEADPDDARARMFAAFFDRRLGTLLTESGQHEQALEHQRRSHLAAQQLVDANPTDVRALSDLASACMTLAGTHEAMERHAEALRWRERAIELHRQLLAINADLARVRHELAGALIGAAGTVMDMVEAGSAPADRLPEARERLAESVSLLDDLAAQDDTRERVTRDLETARISLERCDELIREQAVG